LLFLPCVSGSLEMATVQFAKITNQQEWISQKHVPPQASYFILPNCFEWHHTFVVL